MANERALGKLKIWVVVRLHGDAQSRSDTPVQAALHYGWGEATIPVVDMNCTRVEADSIATRFRKENPAMACKIVWDGPVDL